MYSILYRFLTHLQDVSNRMEEDVVLQFDSGSTRRDILMNVHEQDIPGSRSQHFMSQWGCTLIRARTCIVQRNLIYFCSHAKGTSVRIRMGLESRADSLRSGISFIVKASPDYTSPPGIWIYSTIASIPFSNSLVRNTPFRKQTAGRRAACSRVASADVYPPRRLGERICERGTIRQCIELLYEGV